LGRRAADEDGRKVLVVDDDADWREFLKLCLEDLGYEAIEAANGQEALDSLAQRHYGVMLLDLNMPGMSGFEVLERMPRSGTPPRVVFLTAAAAQDVGGALRTGPHYYLPKGASRDQLSLLLQSLHT
jgi:CheY-like chemotaxis protein